MTPQALKSAILQLAIQGKLVPQRPEEGSAAPLLRPPKSSPPRTPKSSLPRSLKSSVPSSPFPPGTEPPFDIPETWRWVLLPQVADILYGFPFDSQQFNDIGEGMPLIRIRDVLPAKTKTFTTESCPPRYLIHDGDMLVGMDGNFNVGFWQGGDAYLNQRVCKISASSDFLSQAFLCHYLPFALEKIEKNASFVTVKHLSAKHLRTTSVPLPPLPEQHRIVAKIEELLPLIDRYEQAWTQLEDFNRRFPADMQKSLLQLAIQGKLVKQRPEEGTGEQLYRKILSAKKSSPPLPSSRPSSRLKSAVRSPSSKQKPLPPIAEDEIPFEIPESWKWVKLGEICTIFTGKRDANFGSKTGPYYFFTCAKEPIRCDSFSFSGEAILMAGNGDLGNISYYTGNFEAYQRTYVLQPYMEFTYLKYVLYHLWCNWVAYNQDKTFGTAIPYIRLGNVQNYLVALPPLAEQKRIVAKLEELLPLCERLK